MHIDSTSPSNHGCAEYTVFHNTDTCLMNHQVTSMSDKDLKLLLPSEIFSLPISKEAINKGALILNCGGCLGMS